MNLRTETSDLVAAIVDAVEYLQAIASKPRDPYDDGYGDPEWEDTPTAEVGEYLRRFIERVIAGRESGRCGLSFGKAIHAMKQGSRVTRDCTAWDGCWLILRERVIYHCGESGHEIRWETDQINLTAEDWQII